MLPALFARPIAVALTPDGYLTFRGPEPPGFADFAAALPSGRFARARGCWTARATPLAAWKVVREPPEGVTFQVGDDVRRLADRHAETVAAREAVMSKFAAIAAADDPTAVGAGLPQPPILPPGKRLRNYQVAAYHFDASGDATLLDVRMGLGKSAVAVVSVVNAGDRRTLVLCPAKALGVWRREFLRWAEWGGDRVLVLDGSQTAARKAAIAAKHLTVCEGRHLPAVVAVSFETARSPAFLRWAKGVAWCRAIVDESQRIKSHDADVSRAAAEIGRNARRRLCLTGTAMHDNPLDVFGQFRFLEPAVYGTGWHPFRNRYAVLGGFEGKQVVNFQNVGDLAERMRPFTFRIGQDIADRLLQLPGYVDEVVPVELSAEVRRLYDEFERELVAEVRRGEFPAAAETDDPLDALIDAALGDGDPALLGASNPMVKLLRLQQLVCGYAVTETPGGVEETIRVGTEKRDAFEALIDGVPADEPFVAFCRFRPDLDAVADAARRVGRRYGEVSGRRNDLDSHAEMPPGYGVFGVQVQSGGAGVDLTRARYAALYSLGFSLGDYDQLRARLHRSGQQRCVVFYHLVGSGTVDERLYRRLSAKRSVVDDAMAHLRTGGGKGGT